MDDSHSVASATAAKFPQESTGPSDSWTIEQLVHWSLYQYQSKVEEQTNANIASLRNQCEKECEDVMTMHEMAVDMAKKNNNKKQGDDDNNNISGEENVNPQSEHVAPEAGGEAVVTKTASTISASSSTVATTASSKSASSTIQVEVTVGPHTSSKYLLRPKPSQPCFLGRSKGKKFIKNGVSLHKDQEVSTTHGKFLMEEGSGSSDDANKFYFVDVGSTNGTQYNGERLEENVRLELADGMELHVGNSVLRVIL